jgi:curved DNA-binding protein CbpA
VKTYYDLLQVSPGASAAEIKHAFRQQIARYHPDKVQHLGDEFQDLAQKRSAELTIAYKTLVDPEQRDAYDRSLTAVTGPDPEPMVAPPPPKPPPPASAEPRPEPAANRLPLDSLRAGRDAVLKRATLARVDQLFDRAFAASERPDAPGFDLSCLSKPKLFGRSGRSWLLARFVPRLTSEAVQEIWTQALRASTRRKATVSVFVLAGEIGSKRDIADALATNRRRATTGMPGVTIIPVDVRDWQTWVPTDADPAAKALAVQLRKSGGA